MKGGGDATCPANVLQIIDGLHARILEGKAKVSPSDEAGSPATAWSLSAFLSKSRLRTQPK
eukprot:scaffold29426_cov148-Skeletonema_menzelii.AAC.2